MCGIVGIATAYSNGLSAAEIDTFKNMLFVDSLRGRDSTGVFVVENDGDVSIAKEATHVCSFQEERAYSDILHAALMQGTFLVGHNRAATRGAITDKNAHPFWINDEIVLVQNGTWVGDHKHIKNTEVDTETVAHIIAEESDIQAALKRINAAYALVWYNVKKRELYILRNNERPLWMANTEDGGLVWASEPDFIVFAANRANLKLKAAPYLLLDDNLVTLKAENNTWTLDNTKVSTRYVPPKVKGEKKHTQQALTLIGSTTPSASSVSNPPAPKLGDVDRTLSIHHYAQRCTFADWHVNDVEMARKMQHEFIAKKGPVYLEMVDYLPVDKNCKDWYLIFSEVAASSRGKEDPGPVFWAMVRDAAEENIMKMINEPFAVAVVGSPIVHGMVDHNTNQKEFVCLVRINEFMKAEVDEKAKAIH